MKKLTAVIMAALLTVSFAACSTSTIKSADDSKKRGPAAESSVEEVQSEQGNAEDTAPEEDGGEADSLEAMEKDAAAITMYVKEAINTYKAEIETTKWNGKTASEATVYDVCTENNIDYSSDYYKRTIGEDSYTMFYNISQLQFEVHKSDEDVDGTVLTGSETIAELSGEEGENNSLEAMENDAKNINMYMKEAINTYKANITSTKWYGKTASEATVHEVCVENGVDDSSDYYSREIDGNVYKLVFVVDERGNQEIKAIGDGESFKGFELTGSEKIADLAETTRESLLSVDGMKADAEKLSPLVQAAVTAYKDADLDSTWNNKKAVNATVHDVCAENGIDDPDDFYTIKLNEITYTMVFTKSSEIEVSGGDSKVEGITVTADTTIVDLSK